MVSTTILPDEGYEGVEVRLGKYVYVAPPLTLKALRSLLPKISALSKNTSIPTEEDFNTISELVHTTLKRNYPTLTLDDVEEGLDMKNIQEVMTAILSASGLNLGNQKAATEPT